MVGKVQLSFDQRQGLYALQQIARFTAQTDRRLTTNERLHSPADGVTDYFIAERLGETVGILEARQNEIGQGIEALTTTVVNIDNLQGFLTQAQSHVNAAKENLLNNRDEVGEELKQNTAFFLLAFNNLILAALDTEYLNLNLITSTEQRLLVRYSDDREQFLRVTGRNLFTITTDFETGGLFSTNGVQRGGADGEVFSLTSNRLVLSNFLNAQTYDDPLNPGTPLDFSFNGFSSLLDYETLGGTANLFFDAITESITRAENRLEIHEQYFANNINILQQREVFTRNFSHALGDGRLRLTEVDVHEEAVTLSVLHTRNGLAISSLSLLDERHGQLLRLLQ